MLYLADELPDTYGCWTQHAVKLLYPPVLETIYKATTDGLYITGITEPTHGMAFS
jgi:hypothetical protein